MRENTLISGGVPHPRTHNTHPEIDIDEHGTPINLTQGRYHDDFASGSAARRDYLLLSLCCPYYEREHINKRRRTHPRTDNIHPDSLLQSLCCPYCVWFVFTCSSSSNSILLNIRLNWDWATTTHSYMYTSCCNIRVVLVTPLIGCDDERMLSGHSLWTIHRALKKSANITDLAMGGSVQEYFQ